MTGNILFPVLRNYSFLFFATSTVGSHKYIKAGFGV
jgi:hypothetical protein